MFGLVAGLIGACADKPRAPSGADVSYWEPQIQKASKRFNVPPEWIREVMRVESGGRTTWKGGQPITSSAGAQGLMQVMPDTYAELREKHGLGRDPYDPDNNIMAGTAYIRELYDMYGSPGFLGAYNAGPGRYKQYVEQGRDLPPETRRYMETIGTQIAGITPGSSPPDRMTQYAEQQIRQRVDGAVDARTGAAAGAPVVVAAMQPIPDNLSPGEQQTRQRVETAIAGRTGQLPVQSIQMLPIPDQPAPARVVVSRPVVVAMQPIPDRVAPAPVAVIRPAPVRMAPIPDRPQVAPVDDVLLAMAASEPQRPAPAPVAPMPVRAAPVTTPKPVLRAQTQPAVAPTRVARTPAPVAAGPAPVRRQASGLPSGWYVPAAPGK